MKELADRSNVLAVNAAIEAASAGEAGKGFSVVAREIRTLSDQSIEATTRVREILQDVTTAIRNNVQLSERGREKVENSLVQVRTSGAKMRELSGIVRENVSAIRRISSAVGAQDTRVVRKFSNN